MAPLAEKCTDSTHCLQVHAREQGVRRWARGKVDLRWCTLLKSNSSDNHDGVTLTFMLTLTLTLIKTLD